MFNVGSGVIFSGGITFDTSAKYQLASSTSTVTEGESVTFTLTTNVDDDVPLYWTNSGTTTDADFSDSANNGTITRTNGVGTVTRTIAVDQINDASETLVFEVRTDSISGPIVATASSVSVENIAITYSVTPSTTTPTEGDTVTWTVNTTNFGSGTLYWTLAGTTASSDYTNTALSGTITITDNVGTLSKTIATDQVNDVNETAIFQLRSGSTSGSIVATASTVTISNLTVTYAIVPSVTTVNEGSTVTWTVTTTNFGSGTLYYNLTGGTASTSDYTTVSSSGSITITNNTGAFSKTITSDYLTEGAETLIALLRIGGTLGTTVATSATVTIADTATASIVPNTTSANEGDTITWTVTMAGFGNGTLYWTNSGTTNSGDFDDNLTYGTISITNNTGTLVRTVKLDEATEGPQTAIIQLKTGSISGTLIATSATVTIADTSLPMTFSITPNVTQIYETETSTSPVVYTITTTNFGTGTLYYTNWGDSTGADFTDGVDSGSIAITNNSGTLTKTFKINAVTDTPKTLKLELRRVSTSGSVVAGATTVTINSLPVGQAVYARYVNTDYVTTWTAPEGVTSVSVLCIGGGAGGICGFGYNGYSLGGGGGGALAYVNNYTVVPGQSYELQGGRGTDPAFSLSHGTDGTASYFVSSSVCYAGGGKAPLTEEAGGLGGTYTVSGGTSRGGGNGGAGGIGGTDATGDTFRGAGGGGAGGYTGAGGKGGNVGQSGSNGAGGGGGGGSGAVAANISSGGAGGGVGLFGSGSNGTGGSISGGASGTSGTGGSGGGSPASDYQNLTYSEYGGAYGGGAGSAPKNGSAGGGGGADGAVRIIWPGNLRQFPSTRTADE